MTRLNEEMLNAEIAELLKQAENGELVGKKLTGQDGVFAPLIKKVVEVALGKEIDKYLE